MVKISIATLIYKSTAYADWIYNNIYKYTPKLRSGEAEFYFIANDPTKEIVQHLKELKCSYYVNINTILNEKQMWALGYAKPEYISRVYRGYNEAIRRAKGHIVVLINSDMCFSEDWLENLLKFSDLNNIVCSKLVERNHPQFGVFPGAYEMNFGNDPNNFIDKDFQKFVKKNKVTGLEIGGAYMPCMLYKETAEIVGLFPDGNIANKSYEDVYQYGDQNFIARLNKIGVKHITSMDSIVYHFKEGEKEEKNRDKVLWKQRIIRREPRHVEQFKVDKQNNKLLERWIMPTKRHEIIISTLILHELFIKKIVRKIVVFIKNRISKVWMRIRKS